jgi:hypothetical protein
LSGKVLLAAGMEYAIRPRHREVGQAEAAVNSLSTHGNVGDFAALLPGDLCEIACLGISCGVFPALFSLRESDRSENFGRRSENRI